MNYILVYNILIIKNLRELTPNVNSIVFYYIHFHRAMQVSVRERVLK